MTNSINYVVSLGSSCMPAIQLKRKGLKVASYPFDWAKSTIESLYLILKSGLSKNYLDVPLENWKSLPQIRFIHHDIRLNERKNYFKRCDDRLRFLLDQPHDKKVLFIRFEINKDNSKAQNLYRCINESSDNKLKFSLIYINWMGIDDPKYERVHYQKDNNKDQELIVYNIWSRHWPHRQYMLEWLDDKDECEIWDKILEEFKFELDISGSQSNNNADRKTDHYDLEEGLLYELYDNIYGEKEKEEFD